MDKLSHKPGEPFGPPLCPSILNGNGLALDPAQIAKPLPERLEKGRGRRPVKIAYLRDLGSLLCVGGKRRREESDGDRDAECRG
jgi:hypothetical protein